MPRPALVLFVVLVACAARPRVAFHPTDRTFTPKPGPRPAAYTRANLAELPDVPMHSVGTIEVVISRGDTQRAIELAIEKGRELGCWVVVERAAFAERRASRDHGARIIRVHGGPPHAPHVRPRSEVVELECVIAGAAPSHAGRPRHLRPGSLAGRVALEHTGHALAE